MAEERDIEFQAGGHVGAFKATGKGMIRKEVREEEFSFYLSLRSRYPGLVPFVPHLHGTSTDEEGRMFVLMEDLTRDMHFPSVLDVKLGLQSHHEGQKADKVERMKKKDTESTTSTLGMRITGMRVYNLETKTYRTTDKPWGRAVKEEGTQAALASFFHDGRNLRKKELKQMVEVVEEIAGYMRQQTQCRIFSSSLLFVYDSCCCSVTEPRVRMIDFAHVLPPVEGQVDASYVHGITSVLHYLRNILAQ